MTCAGLWLYLADALVILAPRSPTSVGGGWFSVVVSCAPVKAFQRPERDGQWEKSGQSPWGTEIPCGEVAPSVHRDSAGWGEVLQL